MWVLKGQSRSETVKDPLLLISPFCVVFTKGTSKLQLIPATPSLFRS